MHDRHNASSVAAGPGGHPGPRFCTVSAAFAAAGSVAVHLRYNGACMTSSPDQLRDTFGRPLRSLRISVTDRCNLRCRYCMPEEDYVWLPRREILDFEEIHTLAEAFVRCGVRRLRITGGEPLLRRGLEQLIAMLAQIPGIEDIAMTTNGLLLPKQARRLAEAGLRRITISIDTLRPERFKALTGSDGFERLLAGIDAAVEAGLRPLKFNTVVMRGVNDDELPDLLEFARGKGAELRFIEYMDVGGATRWSPRELLPAETILAICREAFGAVEPLTGDDPHAPARRYRLADGTVFGLVASTTRPFCQACDRSRLTADGMWYLCLYAHAGIDLKRLVRRGASVEQIACEIRRVWRARDDRGAERRRKLRDRGPLVPLEVLRRDVRLEMHTRGG